MVGDSDEDDNFDKWIKPTIPEQSSLNWTTEDISVVTFAKE